MSKKTPKEALKALVEKLDEIEPHINSAFMMAYTIRGGQYDGPTYEQEMKDAREALK